MPQPPSPTSFLIHYSAAAPPFQLLTPSLNKRQRDQPSGGSQAGDNVLLGQFMGSAATERQAGKTDKLSEKPVPVSLMVHEISGGQQGDLLSFRMEEPASTPRVLSLFCDTGPFDNLVKTSDPFSEKII